VTTVIGEMPVFDSRGINEPVNRISSSLIVSSDFSSMVCSGYGFCSCAPADEALARASASRLIFRLLVMATPTTSGIVP
jgi:hypothetical protein